MGSSVQKPTVQKIEHQGLLLGMIISKEFNQPGVSFFTPGTLSQQVGVMRHPAGKIIHPHLHNRIERQVTNTQEVLIIRQGRIRVDFYDPDKNYLYSATLGAGDILLLVSGGHGFEVLEDLEMIEVKQGPYAAEDDKVRFDAVESRSLRPLPQQLPLAQP